MLNSGIQERNSQCTARDARDVVIPKLAETMAAVVEAANDDLRVSPNAMTRHGVERARHCKSISNGNLGECTKPESME
ncbi:hypothetical protein FQR65_LT15611 [Abscondita terminalis]|nr:hypothetical protein FQR65_LT15611 [Abscondita terminalis]